MCVPFNLKGRVVLDNANIKEQIGDEKSSSFGIGPVSAEGSGMIKVAPGFRTPIGGVKAGPEAGVNILEFGMRVAEPVREGIEGINFVLAKDEMLRQIADLRQQIPARIDNLQKIQSQSQQEVYWVSRSRPK